MDCFRSVLPGTPVDVGPVLEGLAGGVDCEPPKKSNPNKLSPGLVCFGGAATAARGGTGLLIEGSAVLGLAGAGPERSPHKSISCGLALGACSCPTGALPFLILFPLALSCTTFSGTSSSFPSPS